MNKTFKSTRRHFLSTGSAAIITAATSLRAQQKADSQETLRVGLIGCGGRGTGAAAQALQADYNTQLVAVADIFEKQIDLTLESLNQKYPDRVKITPETRFIGLDAYQKLIDCGVDVVLLATPPGFRPHHLKAAIEAGKHVFCEKPMAVDAVGYHVAQAALAKAKEKKLNVMAGFCWRYSPSRREAFQRLHDGEFGELVGYQGTFIGSPIKPMAAPEARPKGMSDVEWQLANWYNFSWLSGDGYVEQTAHSVDKMLWAFGDKEPLSCMAFGGRAVPNLGGNTYDHLHAIYEMPGGFMANITHRHSVGCHGENIDYIQATEGRLTIGMGAAPVASGKKRWRYKGDDKFSNMYQVEHDELFAAIRGTGKPIFDGDWMMRSTLTAIMARESAYTGQKITWEQILASKQDLAPEETLKWADSFEPTPRPVPGVTKFI
jgi:predicted dehydrogenase